MRNRTLHLLCLSTVAAWPLVAKGEITYSTPDSPVIQIQDIEADQVFADQLAGMRVIVEFSTGGSEELIWESTGLQVGGVFSPNGWQITSEGNTFTYFGPFIIEPNPDLPISAMTFVGVELTDGIAEGGVVWDREYSDPDNADSFGTSGTLGGDDLVFLLEKDPNIDFYNQVDESIDASVQYLNPIDSLADDGGPLGDAFGTFRVDITSDPLTTRKFMGQDSDLIAFRAVPEPTSFGLLATAGLCGLTRRRR